MDIKMPGVNGVEAFRAMRAIRPDLRVVLMSAYTAPDLIAEAEREGVARVLSKPVNPAALLQMLEQGGKSLHPVLIIDTDATYLRTLSDLLLREGYPTVLADGLEHATRLLSEQRPAVVLLHLHLGSVSAREAVTTVHRARPEAALIVYSGRPELGREVAETVPEGWVHAYLEKPFEPSKVTRMLSELHGSA
jgi:DNA-binding NtrC family response regulator